MTVDAYYSIRFMYEKKKKQQHGIGSGAREAAAGCTELSVGSKISG